MPITSTSTLRLNSTPILPRVSLSDTRVACRAKKRPGGRQYRVSRRCRRRGHRPLVGDGNVARGKLISEDDGRGPQLAWRARVLSGKLVLQGELASLHLLRLLHICRGMPGAARKRPHANFRQGTGRVARLEAPIQTSPATPRHTSRPTPHAARRMSHAASVCRDSEGPGAGTRACHGVAQHGHSFKAPRRGHRAGSTKERNTATQQGNQHRLVNKPTQHRKHNLTP